MEDKNSEIFWNASLIQIKKGFIEDKDKYRCVICEEEFQKGRIYEIESMLYDAQKAAELHIKNKHGSVLKYILNMNSDFTGISEIQGKVLTLIASGISDKEAAIKLGVASSTIRNHKFKLREKEKQARLFLAVMELINERTDKNIAHLDGSIICDAHKTATTIDDRYNITDKEKAAAIKVYFDENGALKNFPAKEKKKIAVLQEIVKNFSAGKTYSEREINRILKRVFEDYATIRRALVEYGFIDRTNDGSQYWVKE